MTGKVLTYLALGDSYTIGEGVAMEDNFPNQTVSILNRTAVGVEKSLSAAASPDSGYLKPLIIARTGWTTDELDAAIDETGINETFDIVSLLIGVNNQYRGRSVNEYKVQFDHLLQRAIGFAADKTTHVFVLSIPDWGVTPFADGRDRQEIATAIDGYNAAAAAICQQHHIVFIDITQSQRADGIKAEYLVSDGLHPSRIEYAKWAAKLADAISKAFHK